MTRAIGELRPSEVEVPRNRLEFAIGELRPARGSVDSLEEPAGVGEEGGVLAPLEGCARAPRNVLPLEGSKFSVVQCTTPCKVTPVISRRDMCCSCAGEGVATMV